MRLLIVLLLATAALGEVRSRELEELAQSLRPLEERFARQDPAQLDPPEIISIFHDLWIRTRRAAKLAGADAGLARDFRELGAHSYQAAHAAQQIDPVHYRRGTGRTANQADRLRLERARRMAVLAVQHADRAAQALERIMRRFPLYTGTLEWGPRPLPPARR